MTRCRKKIIKTSLFLTIFVIIFVSILSAEPRISSIVINPPNPGYGDNFTASVTYCGQLYNNHTLVLAVSTKPAPTTANLSGTGQVFLVTKRGINVQFSAATGGEDLGLVVQTSPGAVATDCSLCNGTDQGKQYTKVFNLTMPSPNDFPGCNNTQFYIHVAMKDSNMGESEWTSLVGGTCAFDTMSTAGWTIPTPPAMYNINKRAEGVIADVGDLLLFSIDYEYANGVLVLTDTIPTPPSGQFTLVSVGPLGIWSGPALGCVTPACSGTPITWTLPSRVGQPGKASGTVWYLLRMTGDIPDGTVIQNTINGNMAGVGAKSHMTSVTVGQAVVSLRKSAADYTANLNDIVTFFLEYSINGSKLVAYQPFDDMATGTYNEGTGAPAGWKWESVAGKRGTWNIEDACGTGDRTLQGAAPTGQYPGLLYDGGGSFPSFCTGIIVSDVMIEADYEGADALIVVRSNNKPGTTGAISYAVGISVDNNFGSAATQLGMQRCVGDPATCTWPPNPLSATIPDIETNVWYRVKVEAVTDYHFRAKVWRRGDPEPTAWQLDWTDASPPGGASCASDTWRTGYGEQGGDAGTFVNDNNFVIYTPRSSVNTTLYDTYPANITYQGNLGPTAPTTTSPQLRWNLGVISNESGSYTWWGRANDCNPITNKSAIAGVGIATVDSNQVVVNVFCTTMTSLTKTASPNFVRLGDTVTFTLSYCNVGQLPINPYYIWDTKPTFMTYIGGDAGIVVNGSVYSWSLGSLAVGACGSKRWWGTVTSMPFNPLFENREIFAAADKNEFYKLYYMVP
jgi:uncharacterized repeat protein (TIGR01451 family)